MGQVVWGRGSDPSPKIRLGFYLSLTYGRQKEYKPKIWDFGFWDSLFGFREGSIDIPTPCHADTTLKHNRRVRKSNHGWWTRLPVKEIF